MTTATGDGGIGEIVTTLFKGLTLPPSATKMERILSHFDKLTAIKASRALNAEEHRIYANMSRHVITNFDAASKAIPIMLKKYKQRALKMNGGGNSSGNNYNNGMMQQQHGGGGWENAVKFVGLISMFIGNMIDSIKAKFAGMADEKTMSLLEQFQPARLMKMLGVDADDPSSAAKVNGMTEKMTEAIEGMQRTVVNGIGSAATASMDMVLNAFSMLPGLGTTLLIWRMFQNVMVILGASMNVQAGTTKTATAASGIVAGAKAGATPPAIPPAIPPAAGATAGAGAEGAGAAGAEGAGAAGSGAAGSGAAGGEGAGAAGAGAAGGEDGKGADAAAPAPPAAPAPAAPAPSGKGAGAPVVPQGGGGDMNQKQHHSIINGARALHQSLKRFSGLSARMGSFNNSNSKTRTNRKHAPININDVNPLASSYALKRLFLFQQPGLKPVAAR